MHVTCPVMLTLYERTIKICNYVYHHGPSCPTPRLALDYANRKRRGRVATSVVSDGGFVMENEMEHPLDMSPTRKELICKSLSLPEDLFAWESARTNNSAIVEYPPEPEPAQIQHGIEHCVMSWGLGGSGQLGLNTFENALRPVVVKHDLFDVSVVMVACGLNCSIILTDDGRVYTCGRGAHGVLGHGPDLVLISTPRAIDALVKFKIRSVSCRNEHAAAVSVTGEVLTWGNNSEGQLGHGDIIDRARPVVVMGLHSYNVTQCAAGGAHTLFMDLDGKVWACGQGDHK